MAEFLPELPLQMKSPSRTRILWGRYSKSVLWRARSNTVQILPSCCIRCKYPAKILNTGAFLRSMYGYFAPKINRPEKLSKCLSRPWTGNKQQISGHRIMGAGWNRSEIRLADTGDDSPNTGCKENWDCPMGAPSGQRSSIVLF